MTAYASKFSPGMFRERAILILSAGFSLLMLLAAAGCTPMHQPADSFSPDSAGSEKRVQQLQPGFRADIQTASGEQFEMLVTSVGETHLEGEASSWETGAQWMPVRISLDDLDMVDGRKYVGPGRSPEEEGGRDHPESIASTTRPGQMPVPDEPPAVVTKVSSGEGDEEPNLYAGITAQLEKGEVVDVLMHTGESFSLTVQDVGPDYLSGIPLSPGGSGEAVFAEKYPLAQIRSINGRLLPVDFSRFSVGDRVELITANNEVMRVKISDIGSKLISGTVLDDSAPAYEKGSAFEVTRDSIKLMKPYVPTSETVSKVLKVVGKGVLIAAAVVALAGVAFMMILLGMPPIYM